MDPNQGCISVMLLSFTISLSVLFRILVVTWENTGGGWLDQLSVGDLGCTKLNNFSAVKLGYANVNGQEGCRIAHFPDLISEPFCQEIAHVFSGTYLGTCCSVKKVTSQHNLITYRLRDIPRHKI